MAQPIEENPFERLSTGTLDARLGRETQVKGMSGSKPRRRTSRPDQIALKTSALALDAIACLQDLVAEIGSRHYTDDAGTDLQRKPAFTKAKACLERLETL